MNLRAAGSRAYVKAVVWRVRRLATAHPVLFVFVVALIVRATLAIVLSASLGMTSAFPDTATYDRLASDLVSGGYHRWGSVESFLYDRLSSYVLPLAGLYWVFGRHLFLGQFLAALFGAVAAAATCRLTLLASGRRAALVAGGVVALFSSHVLWSSVAYKDSAVWAASAVLALLAALGARARGWRLLLIGIAMAALVFVLGHLRIPTTVVVCWAMVVAALFSVRQGRMIRVAGALAITVFLLWFLGLGPAGEDEIRPLGNVRAEAACHARSAFTECKFGAESSAATDLRHLPRGLSVMLVEPLPWTSPSGAQLRLAQAELLLWLPLLAIAVWGVPEAFRHRRELAFLVLTAGALLVVYALGEGNLGTAYRHRSELVPALAVLAALGAPRIAGWWKRRSREAAPEPKACGRLSP